ncbi:hypothetical protein [Streptomyces chromofuscus]|uniref:Uncharacterized protein n=1 Tax=Streptomyces chromofuscus TaxID=42881 RepID=A0A7M2TDU2_STRCW|nr:hypothetical protein [Streptomyces chromofuscus]QOV46394.1 hypothetical protein IPT68_11090 [Streptomyces chromofuscus]GGS94705.1 hypothetical protein GCM10010254_13330 [Streptomyces chromofuscus]
MCLTAEVRGDFHEEHYYTGRFTARCLCKVLVWDEGRRKLTLDPVAIFR